jgi:hypothetical protein
LHQPENDPAFRSKFFAHHHKLRLVGSMADYEHERVWDEYDWERFLQQQDQKTEKYMELLEKYLDDPQRDEIIAREMGWSQVPDTKDWSAEVDALLHEGAAFDSGEGFPDEDYEVEPAETFEEHSLYQAAFALTIWIDQLFDRNASLQNDPAAVKLATHSALASAKLAAALNDEDVDEIGMTIAYLKRALKAITVSIDAAIQLLSKKRISAVQHGALQERLFAVRDGIITLMGEYRREWQRRYGCR